MGLVRQVQLAVEDASYLDPYLVFTCITIYFVPFTTNINLQNLAHKNLLALKLKLTNFSNEISWSSFFSDIPLNRKMAPASDWLFFCSILWNSRTTRVRFFVIDMRKYLKNVARVFTWIEEEDEGLKDGNCSYQMCIELNVSIEYFLYLLSSLEVSFELLFYIHVY